MHRKLGGYSLLSVLSFCFFTLVFHAVADAQASATSLQPLPAPSQAILPVIPTPTLFVYHPSSSHNTTGTKSIISPTPTLFVQEASQVSLAPAIAPDNPTGEPAETPMPTPMETVAPAPTVLVTVAVTATPTPTASLTPQPTALPGSSDLETLFSTYSKDYQVDENELKKIAQCESGFNSNSNNSGLYLGMFQFAATSWESVRSAMGLDTNPDLRTDAQEAIRTAAYMLAHGEENAWPNCK